MSLNLFKMLTGFVLLICLVIGKVYQIQGLGFPLFLKYLLIILGSLFLITFLFTYNKRTPPGN
jgi:hypothetical protein